MQSLSLCRVRVAQPVLGFATHGLAPVGCFLSGIVPDRYQGNLFKKVARMAKTVATISTLLLVDALYMGNIQRLDGKTGVTAYGKSFKYPVFNIRDFLDKLVLQCSGQSLGDQEVSKTAVITHISSDNLEARSDFESNGFSVSIADMRGRIIDENSLTRWEYYRTVRGLHLSYLLGTLAEYASSSGAAAKVKDIIIVTCPTLNYTHELAAKKFPQAKVHMLSSTRYIPGPPVLANMAHPNIRVHSVEELAAGLPSPGAAKFGTRVQVPGASNSPT